MQCPLCRSTDTRLLAQLSTADLCAAWLRDKGIDITAEFAGVERITRHACGSCDLEFFGPPNAAGSARLYEALGQGRQYYLPNKWEYHQALRDLSACGRVLEVGCGRGRFIEMARGVCRVEGIEINAAAVESARAQGLEVERVDLHDRARRVPGAYDAVCAFQVLEHVPDPASFLQGCLALLRPGGRLVIGVPNAQSFLRSGTHLLDLPPHHMLRFSPSAMRRVCEHLPLRLLDLRFEPLASVHAGGYVSAMCPSLSRLGGARVVYHPRFRAALAWLIAHTGARLMLRGQSLYALYERL